MTFKENVPDIRNSKVVDLYRALGDYGITPVACDPMVDVEQMQHEYGSASCRAISSATWTC